MSKLGALAALRRLIQNEAPAQAAAVDEALKRAYVTGHEHSVVGPAIGGPAGRVTTQGRPSVVKPNLVDITRARQASGPAFDLHTHPTMPFGVTPSRADFDYWRNNYYNKSTMSSDPRLRVMTATPPERVRGLPQSNAQAGHMFFETDKPGAALKGSAYDDATQSMIDDAAMGRFNSVLNDRRLRDLFYDDMGGDASEEMRLLSPLALLNHYARNRGLGRLSVRMPNMAVEPSGELRDQELMERFLPLMTERLKARGFADGGAVY